VLRLRDGAKVFVLGEAEQPVLIVPVDGAVDAP
jgi:hypothetical protein